MLLVPKQIALKGNLDQINHLVIHLLLLKQSEMIKS